MALLWKGICNDFGRDETFRNETEEGIQFSHCDTNLPYRWMWKRKDQKSKICVCDHYLLTSHGRRYAI